MKIVLKRNIQTNQYLWKNIPEYKEDAYVKIVGVFNGRKKDITKLNEYEIAAVKEVDRIFDEKLVNDYIRKQYDIQTVPWDSIAALYDGKYGVKIPPKHLYDMFVRKQSYLDKINAQNVAKGKDITGVLRVKYDLKVLYNKYDSYLKFLEKQKILEAEAQSNKADEKLILTTAPQPKKVETNNNSDDSLDDLLIDIFG